MASSTLSTPSCRSRPQKFKAEDLILHGLHSRITAGSFKKVTKLQNPEKRRELLKMIMSCLYFHVQNTVMFFNQVLLWFMIRSLLKCRAESGLFQISHLSTWTESMAITQSSFDLRNLDFWIFYQSPTHWSNTILWGFCPHFLWFQVTDSCERHNEIHPGMDNCMTVVLQSWLQPP